MTSIIEDREDDLRPTTSTPEPDAVATDEPSAASNGPLGPDVVRTVGRGLTVLGLLVLAFVVYLVAITPLMQGRDQRGLDRRFRSYVETQQTWIGGEIPEGEPVAKLEIPSIGFQQIVIEGTDGSQLRKGPGHERTSALPGQAGNAVIECRRVTYGAPCLHLDRLAEGDLIEATTGQAITRYLVTKVFEVSRKGVDVIDPTRDNRLTLVTSAPLLRASRRLVVTAELQRKEPLPTEAARPTDLRTDELGLHGDRSGGFGVLLWLEALALAAVGAVLLRRRWSRWTTWLVMAPIIALLVVLVFDSVAPVLPSTL
ncbi:MAG: sortase [Acidimicrobiia bacterium]|nr:sortase [Acidimicrobiia bacterium]